MTALHQSRDIASGVADRLRLYAQPQRLMILSFLLGGEQSVGAIDAATGVGQPALSQQLAELRHAGLLTSRRAARQVYYRLADAGVESCVRAIETLFIETPKQTATNAPARSQVIARAIAPAASPKPPDHAGAASFAQILR
jgi:DNA-binding transcriptional ArsR family regulator